MAIRKAIGTDDVYNVEENLSKVIGEDNLIKYKEIFPLLALLDYRVWKETDIQYVSDSVSMWDQFVPNNRRVFRKLLHFWGGLFLYLYDYIRTIVLPVNSTDGNTIVMSNTYVNSERYSSANRNLLDTCGYKVFFALCDSVKHGNGDIKESLRKSLKGSYGNLRPIFVLTDSIAGVKLIKLVKNWCAFLLQYQIDNNADEKEVERFLSELEKAYNKRKEYIKKIIKKNSFDMYITVNQYNLRDLLIIQACNELGIRTVQMEHHAMQFSRVNFSVEKPMQRLAYAQEFFLWNEGERAFHEKVFSYYNVFGKDEKLQFKVMGNLELCYEDAVRINEKYATERRVTFMTSALQDTDLDSEEQIEQVKEWRWSIFEQLKLLKEKQNVIIRIRYTPYQEMEFREEEIPVLKGWGFEISDSTPQCLMEDICSSMGVISTTSTVLATARALGRLVFRVEDPAVEYIKVDEKIIDVRVEEISEIILPENSVIGKLAECDFFSAKHIIG